MNKAQKDKLVVSTTIAGVVLLFFFICVLVYQVCMIGMYKKKERALNAQISRLQNTIENTSDELEIWMSNEKIEEIATIKGLKKDGQIDFDNGEWEENK